MKAEASRGEVVKHYNTFVTTTGLGYERAEVVKACPECLCVDAMMKADPETGCLLECINCGHCADVPAYYRRVEAP